MDRLLVVVAVIVTLVWAAVVVVAFAARPIDPNAITLATIVTPVMLAMVGGIVTIVTRRMNGKARR